MLLLRNNDIENKDIAQIIAVALLIIFGIIGIEGAIYNNPHVSAVDNNNISYTMEFIENVVENMPDNILDGLTSGTSSLIPSNNPIRSGFKFAGWCDQVTTKSGDYDVCATGHSHQSGDTISLNQTGVNNIKLYAIWEEEKTIANSTTMQEVNSCPDSIPLETVYTLTDPRDNQTYKVARLKDGKCWMVENLNLAGGTALSADDTDVTGAYISSFSTSNNLTKTGNTIVLPASSTSGFNALNNSYVYNSNSVTCASYSPYGSDRTCYSYYSWDAATLGSGRTIATDNTDAEQSICPKGWKLPTSRTASASNWQTASDFYVLAHQYGLDSTTSTSESDNGFYTQAGPGTTPNFLLAGLYYDGNFYNGGRGGHYWSSTSSSDTIDVSYLYFSSDSVYSATSHFRHYGLSVRCLFSGQ